MTVCLLPWLNQNLCECSENTFLIAKGSTLNGDRICTSKRGPPLRREA